VKLGNYLKNGLIGAFALILAGTRLIPGADSHGPVLFAPATLMAGNRLAVSVDGTARGGLLAKSTAAGSTWNIVSGTPNTYAFAMSSGGTCRSRYFCRLSVMSMTITRNGNPSAVAAKIFRNSDST